MTVYVGSLKYSPVFKSHCCAFGRACEEHGYDVRYLFSSEYNWMLSDEIRRKTTFIGHSSNIWTMLKDAIAYQNKEKIRRTFSTYRPTHVYLHNYHFLNHFISKVAKEFGSRFIYHVHEPYVQDKKLHGGTHQYWLRLFEHFQGELLENTDTVVVSSERAARLFNLRYANVRSRMMKIPLMYEDLNNGSIKSTSGKRGKYLTFVGPPVPAKNPEKFLEIIRYSNDNGLRFKFLLITRFPLDDARFQREENLRVFSKPRISDEEFGDLIRKSLVVLTPYKRETQSSVILVSYMYGVPVISSDIGGLPEFVSHKNSGFLLSVDAGVEEWVEGIQYVKNNFVRLSKNCRRLFSMNFAGKNWERYIDDLLGEGELCSEGICVFS